MMDSQQTISDLTPTNLCANIQKMSEMNIFMPRINKNLYLCNVK